MKKMKLLLATAIMSISVCFPSFAGTWTHTYNSETYNNLWFYVKDDGSYAKDEWIQDSDGTWYWIDKNYQLPSMYGVSKDGGLYNNKGAYIDINDGSTKYLTKELSSQITEGMTYDQVITILGKEHDVQKATQAADGTYDYLYLLWYSGDARGCQYVIFKKGTVHYASSDWK